MRVCRGAKDAQLSLTVQKDGRTLWSQERALRLETEIGYEQLVLPLPWRQAFTVWRRPSLWRAACPAVPPGFLGL